jgi:hypothetical protein
MGRAGGRAAALYRGGAPLGGPPSILAVTWGPLSMLGLYLGAGGPAFRAPLVLGFNHWFYYPVCEGLGFFSG